MAIAPSAILQRLIDRGAQLPAAPSVLLRLMAILSDTDTGMHELLTVLSADPTLTARVIRVANSPFYGVQRQIRTLDDAVMRIGWTEVWSIASTLKAKELFERSQKNWTTLNAILWEHSVRAAIAAKVLSRRVSPRATETFFTAGLLHDLGKTVLLDANPNYPTVCEQGAVWGAPLQEREDLAFGMNHSLIGTELLKHWCLPDHLCQLLRSLHAPVAKDTSKATVLLVLADELAHAWRPDHGGKVISEGPIKPAAIAAAGLSAQLIEGCSLEYARDCLALMQI